MTRTFLAIFVVIALVVVGTSLAGNDGHGKAKVKTISDRDIAEKLDGKDTRVSMLEVTIEPRQLSQPHRHHGPVRERRAPTGRSSRSPVRPFPR